MKNIITVILIGVLLIGCDKTEKKSDGYVIKGTATGIYDGIRIYLQTPGQRGAQINQDTAIVFNETFEFKGKVDYPQVWNLSANNVARSTPIMVENEIIEIELDKDTIENSSVIGTKSNEALSNYTKGFKNMAEKRSALNKTFITNLNATDATKKEKASVEIASINEDMKNYPYKFLESNGNTYFSLSLIENILKGKPTDSAPVEQAFNNLDDAIKNSKYGGIVKVQIDQLKMQNERLSMLDVGKIAPNFSAPNPEAKQVSLNDIKGKVTIIDFWASWCGPCRRENPNVVKIYNKYHDKGLEIISVSLDKPGQKDKWLKAIEVDKLTWHHVSNLNYFNGPVAQQYNIRSIPATFILDADGKIVAKSLRGQQLEDKIAELLN